MATKYYLNKCAGQKFMLPVNTDNGAGSIEIPFDIYGLVGTSIWGVYKTDDESIQSAIKALPKSGVVEISERDYGVYVKKKTGLPGLRQSTSGPAPIRSQVEKADAKSAHREFTKTEIEAVAVPEKIAVKMMVPTQELLAKELGLQPTSAKFRRLVGLDGAPTKGDSGYDVSEWRKFALEHE